MAYAAPYMLATGDYGGRICVWNIFTGERRFTLTHEAPEYQRGVEQLLFLKSPNPNASPILLSCGGTRDSTMLCTSAMVSIKQWLCHDGMIAERSVELPQSCL